MSWSVSITGQKKTVLKKVAEWAEQNRKGGSGPLHIAQIDKVEALITNEVSQECTGYNTNPAAKVGYHFEGHGHADRSSRTFELKFRTLELAIDEPEAAPAPATEAAPNKA